MKKLALLIAAIATIAVVVPAWAAKPAHPAHPTHPAHGKAHKNGKANHGASSCKAHLKGYRASGTLVSASLSPGSKKDHYNGSLTVDVTRANHKAPDGSQTFPLTDARVRFGKGVTSTSTAAGDRVTLHGKMMTTSKHCTSGGSAPVITVRNVRIRAPRH